MSACYQQVFDFAVGKNATLLELLVVAWLEEAIGEPDVRSRSPTSKRSLVIALPTCQLQLLRACVHLHSVLTWAVWYSAIQPHYFSGKSFSVVVQCSLCTPSPICTHSLTMRPTASPVRGGSHIDPNRIMSLVYVCTLVYKLG